MSASIDESVPGPRPASAASGGIPLGVVLLLLAAMAWTFVGLLRCSGGAIGVKTGALAPASAPEPTPERVSEEPAGALSSGLAAAIGADELDEDEGLPVEALADAEAAEETPAEAPAEAPTPATAFSRAFAAPGTSDRWLQGLSLPSTVKYKVRFGGSLVRVANLFKIFHHEIQALNPGVDPERELPAGTRVVVYRRGDAAGSESVDYAGAGSISEPGGVPMVDGPGRILKATPWKTFATAETVAALDQALRRWAKRPGAQKVLVGNMSQRGGGRLKPHSTHQSGRDVDLGYIQRWDGKEELNWRKMNAKNLDAGETWALLQTLVSTGAVEVVFIDRGLQKLLFEHARAQGVSEEALEPWLEYPRRTGAGAPMIQHVAGHDDHIHVRIACPPSQARCKSRAR
jgi:hypothetical protein